MTRFSALLVCLALAACAQSTVAPAVPDMTVSSMVCPGAPSLCPGMCCGSACIDTTLNINNCGACGSVCSAGTICENSKCGCLPSGLACGMGQSCCGNSGCKSLDSDINNCGECGKACGAGSTCVNMQCVCGTTPCTAGQTCCAGVCADTCAGAPDMAMSTCTCASHCPFSGTCVGQNCCVEDVIIGKCSPDPNCMQSNP